MSLPNIPNTLTYWVLPGRLLAGEYPICWDRRTDQQYIRDFLALGITHFVDLTEDTETSQRTYEPICIAEAAEQSKHVIYQRYSVPDGGIPSEEEMIAILDAIDAGLAAGHMVYVHCHAGVGRTGTVVGCYLVRHGLEGTAALDRITELRQSIPPEYNCASPARPAQCQMVLTWRPAQ